ncbi:MAG: CDP-alcohol phosphatidyltransferase family protein [Lutimonas sp.]
MKKYIPNLFTLLNLFSGVLAILMAASDRLVAAAGFVLLGIFFDFFDGFFARKFNVQGELGKQLDSLADVVTSGVVPGIVMFQLLLHTVRDRWFMELSCEEGSWSTFDETFYYFIPFIGLVIPLAAAYRLANFNIDERQTDSFIGLPTPAFAIFVISLPLILAYDPGSFLANWIQSTYVLIGITLAGCYMMNANLPLFSLKFKSYGWKGNEFPYVFLTLSAVLLFLFNLAGTPMIIVLYVIMSLIQNKLVGDKSVENKKPGN